MTSSEPNRLVFLGAGRVGKTSLIQRLLFDSFSERYRPTVEDMYHQEFDISGRRVALDLMDTSGTYNFPAMRKLCIAKATGLVLVLAHNDPYSLQHAREVLAQVKEERQDWTETPLAVVLNKVDLDACERTLDEDEVEAWLIHEDVPLSSLVSTSAKEGEGVLLLFEKLWEQNEKVQRFLISHSPAPDCKRRFSAFASLTSAVSSRTVATNGHGQDHHSPLSTASSTSSSSSSSSGTEFRRKGKFLRSKTSSTTRRMNTNRSSTGSVHTIDCAIS